jgi:hypothetical protein
MNKKEQCSVMLPNQPGMRVIKIHRDFEYKKLLHPDTYGKNKSRSKGTSHKKIEDFTRIIKNGQYTPEHHIAPTVSKIKGTKWFDLKSGKHRVSGHECAGEETMYVIEIEFFEFNGKSATYWEAMWRNNENREDDVYIKNPRTEDDIVMTVVDLIDNKVINKTEKDIELVLNDLHCTNGQIHKLRSLILAKIGKNKGVVTIYANNDLVNFIKDENIKIYPYKILPGKNGHFNLQGEHANRLLNKIMRDLIYNVDSIRNSVIIAQVSGSNHDGVIDARNMFSDMVPKRLKEIEKALKIWKAKKPKIVMKFVPQLYGENKSNELISV